MLRSLGVEVGGRELVLLGERAAFDPDSGTLLVADAHLGKAQSFRRLGVPVPAGTTAENLARLDALLAQTGARRLVFLGDLLHARQARSAALQTAVQAWRQRQARLSIVLVRGNHDDRAGDPPAAWDFAVVDEPWPLGPWALCHHPQPLDHAYVLAGHVHPVAIVGHGPDRLRLPCFHLGPRLGLLPAFGEFTGGKLVPRQAGDRVVLACAGELRPLPGAAASVPSPSIHCRQ